MLIVSDEVAVHGRGGAERDVGTQVVAAGLAELAHATRHARLYRHAVADLQALHFTTNLNIYKHFVIPLQRKI